MIMADIPLTTKVVCLSIVESRKLKVWQNPIVFPKILKLHYWPKSYDEVKRLTANGLILASGAVSFWRVCYQQG